jgi:DNA-binding NarL/FixJ family response regulator
MRIKERCAFTEEELLILDLRRRKKSVVEISMITNLSERTVSRRISSIIEQIKKEL